MSNFLPDQAFICNESGKFSSRMTTNLLKEIVDRSDFRVLHCCNMRHDFGPIGSFVGKSVQGKEVHFNLASQHSNVDHFNPTGSICCLLEGNFFCICQDSKWSHARTRPCMQWLVATIPCNTNARTRPCMWPLRVLTYITYNNIS